MTAAAAAVAAAAAAVNEGGTAKGVVIGRLSFCSHPELHGTLCTSCGRSVVPAGAKEEAGGGGRGKGGEGGAGRGGGGEPVWGSAEDPEEEEGPMSKVTMKGGGTLTVSSTGD